MALRLDTVQQFDPGSPQPIGTLQEVRAMALSPLKYGSCSMPGKNNIGCKHYDDPDHGPCPILQLCRAKNRKGFENVAFVRILNPTNMKQDACECHQYMATLAHSDPRNGVTHILGLGGDAIIKRKGSEVLDPKNPKSKSRTTLLAEKVPAALRPSESMADRAATMQLARDMNVRQAQSLANGLGTLGLSSGGVPPEDTVEAEEGLADGSDGEPLSDDEFANALDGDLGDDLLSDEEPEPEPAVVRAISGRGRKGRKASE
jgi:hypothetical protein